ncbi:MAG: CoA activase [candidate division Zixibacteria bacterium]|nr:CoA activase [candidate division Zixibacteria bacterium]
MKKNLYLGIDIGSVSVKVVLLSSEGEILRSYYKRSTGQPLPTLKGILEDLFYRFNPEDIKSLATTGTGGKLINSILGGSFVNEVIAQVKATGLLCPEVRTVIEMGGEDSKLILLRWDEGSKTPVLEDFSMNMLCAAGTGSFLDQQANRLKISIEDEFGKLALKSKNPPRIAGRCSVFAKSDMIHLQQIATPDYDIVAGLCFAMARNFKGSIVKGKKIQKPISFQGGVAANLGMRRAFESVFGLSEGELVIPQFYKEMGAIGAGLSIMGTEKEDIPFLGLNRLNEYLTSRRKEHKGKEPLVFAFPENKYFEITKKHQVPQEDKIDAFLGIDVGSLSTNVVAIDKDKNVIGRIYLMTEGRPIDAVKRGLKIVGDEIRDKVNILGVGTTGSGRYLTGDFVGADVVHNEITAQAVAAVSIDPKVDTIFEIGGQDSKYVSLQDGAVIDFEMNKVCAAGTGSFLQEQAEKLNINIEEEFGDLALKSKCPVNCGERCTVFMESDLVAHQQSGVPIEDLVAGLAYSIVYNYLNKVVGDKRVGEHIFFQGGVAWNKAVVAAFEKVTEKKITVPPHHDVTGAIGAAILAMEEYNGDKSNFKGFDLSEKEYSVSTFECPDCPNHCEIKEVKVEGEPSLFYGSRCEKYDTKRKPKRSNLPDLFKERERILFHIHKEFVTSNSDSTRREKKKIGIPRSLVFYELFPYWATFFEELGFEVVLSDPTNKRIIRQGVEQVLSETCFPVKVAHGHVLNLLEKKVDYILLPSLINMKKEDDHNTENYACPYVQSLPYVIKAAINIEDYPTRLLTFPVYFQLDRSILLRTLIKLGKELKIKKRQIEKALLKAEKCQEEFCRRLSLKGQDVLRGLKEDQKALVIVGRPYNTCDPDISLNLPKKLADLGVLAIPMDFLCHDPKIKTNHLPNMYWKYGQKILAASEILKNHKNLFGLYVTNFGCGPDSFIIHFFKKNLAGKPFLMIEMDEHSADAGVITRCEAFLDSLKKYQPPEEKRPPLPRYKVAASGNHRTLYIPYMCDHAFAFKAAMNACGQEAHVLEESDEDTLILGRKFTSGKECYPCILTTGDLLKFLKKPEIEPDKVAFFMPKANGPCRFGQYHNLHRVILDEMGYSNVPIISPDSDDSYSTVTNLDGNFRRLAWKGMVATDLLIKLLYQNRPYEKNKGETDRVYRRCLKQLSRTIASKGDIEEILSWAKEMFAKIEKETKERKPIIGVVGEIYIRSNRFSNNDLVRKIEALGGEAWVAGMAEWINYTSYMYKRQSLLERRYKEFAKGWVTDWVQRKKEHNLEKRLEGSILECHESSTDEVLELASPYLDQSFGGEAILSIGKAIDYINQGLSGVVNTMPFTCMPGTVVTAMSKKLREDFGNVPWLNLAYEGQEDANEITRLEAFMHQARDFQKRKSPKSSHHRELILKSKK